MNIKKILIFGGIALVLVAGAGGGVYFFLLPKLSGSGHQTENPAGTEGEAAPEAPRPAPAPEPPPPAAAPAPAAYGYEDEEDDEGVELSAVNQTHVVNLPAGEGGARGGFLRCQISIIVRDPELGKAMTSDTPTFEQNKAKAIVLDTLSMLEAVEVFEHETRFTVAQDIKDKLNEQFKPTKPPADKKAPARPMRPIKDILVVEWAVQSR